MIRIGTVVWFVILALLGVGLFQVKYAVQAKERELKTVNRQITADRQVLRVLEAEWSYLNDPVRLADLARRHTDLTPAMASQIADFSVLRERPAEPAVPADPLISGAEAPLATTPVAATAVDSGATYQASAGAPVAAPLAAPAETASAEVPVDEDATIRAILADMESQQNGTETPAPVSGGAGAE